MHMRSASGKCEENRALVQIRVRGFPTRDIFSLCALGNEVGQGARVVGAPPLPRSASFPEVLDLARKSEANRVCVEWIKQ